MNATAPVRLATFNVLHGRPVRADGRPAAAGPEPFGPGPLIAAATALDADVLALQELDRRQDRTGHTDQARAVAEATGATDWRYATALHARAAPGRRWEPDPAEPGLRLYGPPGTGHDGQSPSHGVALITRLPVLAWHAHRLPASPLAAPLPMPGRPGLTVVRDRPRAALAAVLRGRRGPFTAVVLHLSLFPGSNVRQLLAVRRWIADLPRPHLLLGDFNLGGRLPATALRAADLLTPAGAGTPGGPAGWHDLARARTFPAHRPRLQLDHILASGLPRDHPHTAHYLRLPLSDHRPLVVDLPL
ncbi:MULTISPECIES: endonuclease/exonuclease/phosphatase family protein [Kitasatospora]|uniref:endonuclease/exonuclease/phosphatase family protein n=1 Tax=Kitasatospora TaxID=2063 RepID=UPI0003079D44|nr:endonuclease/exonuclease/phosphatase family protein [Kitasatospora setae]